MDVVNNRSVAGRRIVYLIIFILVSRVKAFRYFTSDDTLCMYIYIHSVYYYWYKYNIRVV